MLSPALLSVTIYGRDAAALDLPFNRTSGPSQDATLDEVNDTAAFTLYLSPDQTADLAGNYVVKFSLGELLISKPVTFSDESTAAPEGFATLKRFAWCDYQLATADFQSALDLATQELSSNPASLPAMSRAAAAMQGLGDTAGALKMLAQAMDAFKQQYPDALHPPADFHRRYSALLSTLAPESVQ